MLKSCVSPLLEKPLFLLKMFFENIPLEMRERVQWVCFNLEGGKKIPYIPGNGKKASSNTPSTWRTFDEAVADVVAGKREYIGYAFSSTDPFFFLDLDEEQPAIFDAFDTYAQRSVSGEGIHLIGRGSFEGAGTHPASPAVGLFKENRFCLMTGDVVENRTTINTVDENELQSLHAWLSKETQETTATTTLVEIPANQDDGQVYKTARERFDTFEHLWNGNAGEDHSESDHALISMLCDVSKSNEQVRRMWFSCPLCRPHRRNDSYVNRTIKKIRGKQEFVDSYFEAETEEEPEVEEPKKEHQKSNTSLIDEMPEGMMKDLILWHFHQSYFPLQEASLAAAFAVAGTIFGRNFQTATGSGKGLNNTIILVGPSACGKNEYQNGITKILTAVSKHNPLGHGFMKRITGPLASGEGVEDAFGKHKRLCSYFPEFHEYYHNLVSPNAAPHHRNLKEKFLNLFEQSSRGSYLQRRVKAKGKDEQDQEAIEAPCLVVAGETTPRAFYEKMTQTEIENGFLPRLTILNVRKSSISRRPNPKAGNEMPSNMLDQLLDMFVRADALEISDEFVTVEMTPEARQLFEAYENDNRDKLLDEENNDLFNRAGLKALRMACCIAVMDNVYQPIVNHNQMMWSIQFIDMCNDDILSRFKSGTIGTGQTQQENEIRELLRKVVKSGVAGRKKMDIPDRFVKFRDVVPYTWLKRKIVCSGAFSSDRNGAVAAFERCLNHMTTAGELVRIAPAVAEEKYGKGCGSMIGMLELG